MEDKFASISKRKEILRQRVLEILKSRSLQEKERSDEALCAAFCRLPQVAQGGRIVLFWGMGLQEPDTSGLIAQLLSQGKRVGLPRVLPNRGMEVREFQLGDLLVPHPWGMQEPAPSAPLWRTEEIELVLVPALCYDRRGFRLGYGGGYYDRWLARYTGDTVGLCPSCVLQQELPRAQHDQKVSILLQEEGPVPLY